MKNNGIRLTVIAVLGAFIELACATGNIEVVTDSWAPYAYEKDNEIVGSDVEVVMAVFKRMEITANIRLLPWKRALNLVKGANADAILDISVTPERKAFLHFPDEHVSEGITVFFKLAKNPLSSVDLNEFGTVSVGAMLGYKYCDELDDSPLISNASRVPTLKQNFKMLLSGRVDLVVEVESVGLHEAGELGISDQVEIVKNARFCAGGNYLAFARKPGYEKLATAFSEELSNFKKTAEYQQIMKKYGMPL